MWYRQLNWTRILVDIDRQSFNFNKMNMSSADGQEENTLDQSLPEYLFNGDKSLSFDFEHNMSKYCPKPAALPTWPDDLARPQQSPVIATMNYDQSCSAIDSSNTNNYAVVFSTSLQDARTRSTSFPFASDVNYNTIDEAIFGASSDSNTPGVSKPRSKSHADASELGVCNIPQYSNAYNLHDESDLSPVFGSPNSCSAALSSPKKFVPPTHPSRPQSTRNYSNSSEDEYCAYCKSIGSPPYGHNKKNCPKLFMLNPCPVCFASGSDNHTLSHCPYSSKTLLEMKEPFKARQNDNIKKRDSQRKKQERRMHGK